MSTQLYFTFKLFPSTHSSHFYLDYMRCWLQYRRDGLATFASRSTLSSNHAGAIWTCPTSQLTSQAEKHYYRRRKRASVVDHHISELNRLTRSIHQVAEQPKVSGEPSWEQRFLGRTVRCWMRSPLPTGLHSHVLLQRSRRGTVSNRTQRALHYYPQGH